MIGGYQGDEPAPIGEPCREEGRFFEQVGDGVDAQARAAGRAGRPHCDPAWPCGVRTQDPVGPGADRLRRTLAERIVVEVERLGQCAQRAELFHRIEPEALVADRRGFGPVAPCRGRRRGIAQPRHLGRDDRAGNAVHRCARQFGPGHAVAVSRERTRFRPACLAA